MDDLDFRGREEEKSGAQLLSKLASQVERDTTKVSVAQEFIEIVRKKFEDKAEMVAIHEVPLHAN